MPAGVELATAYVSLAISGSDVAPQTRKALGAVEREASTSGKRAGKNLSAGMGAGLKGLAGTFAGVIAAVGVKNLIGGALGEARESQKVGAITANVIKQTGGAAKITEKQVGDLASAISRKSGVDDEAIQTGANLLLTFKNVKNEVGTGAKVFDRATQAAVDLSAAGFGSVDGASKMLGKALNDPLKGISALGRAGVTFTAGQKKQIEAMVKAGDVLGAQKIILKEVESQVGGAAAASATAGEKAGVAFGNLKETLGTALLPIIDKVSSFFVDKLGPGIEGVLGILTKGELSGDFLKRFGLQEDSKIIDFLFDVREGAQQLFDLVFKGDFTSGPFSEDSGFVDTLFTVRDGFFTAKEAVSQFIGEFIRGEGAGGTFRDIITGIVDAGAGLATFLADNKGAVVAFGAAIAAVTLITQIHAGVMAVQAAGGIAKYIAQTKIVTAVTKVWTAVQWLMNAALTANPIGLVVLALALLAGGLILAYKKSETFRAIVDGAFKAVGAAASFMWNDVMKPAFRSIVGAFLDLAGSIIEGAAKAFGWVPGIGGKLKGAATEFSKFKDRVNASLDGIDDKTVTVGVKFVAGNRLTSSNSQNSGKNGFNTGGGYAAGGLISGPWRGPAADNVLGISDAGVPTARVNPREYITRVWATDRMERNSPGALAYINKYGELPARAAGGLSTAGRFPTGRGIREATDNATRDLVAANVKALKAALVTSGGGTVNGTGMGWRKQVAWARANIPSAAITSTVRSGNPASDHDKGRAIDLAGGPGMSAIFDRIKGAFSIPSTRSLYYSPKGNRQVRFGRESNTPAHIYNTHFDHVHWAMNQGGRVPSIKPTLYDKGGWVEPGTTVVQNNTGKREYLSPDRDELGGGNMDSLLEAFAALGEDIRNMKLRADLTINGRQAGELVAAGTRSLER